MPSGSSYPLYQHETAELKQSLCFCFSVAERSRGRSPGVPSVHFAGVNHSRGSFQTM